MLDNPYKNRFASYNIVTRPEQVSNHIINNINDIVYPEELINLYNLYDVKSPAVELPIIELSTVEPSGNVKDEKTTYKKAKHRKFSKKSSNTQYDHTISFKLLCDNIGLKVRVTSELRNSGNPKSHHRHKDLWGNSAAIDIVPIDGNFEEFKNKLLASPEARNWFLKRGYGILNEIIPQVKSRTNATGNHFHIGPDKWALRVWLTWLNNPSMKATLYIS